MDWDKLRIFHTVALAGSFTRAAEQLNLSQSAISRQVNGLEESLGVPLFYRHARGLVMTEQGELLFESVREVFSKLAMTEALLNESQGHPRGPLKITTSIAFGSMWLAPLLGEFLELYPHIRVNLILRDDEPDLNMREADISIPSVPPTQPDMVAVPLPPYRLRIYGSRPYFKKFGVPVKPQDLDNHRLIAFGDEISHRLNKVNWILHAGTRRGQSREPYLIVNNAYAILQCVKAGLGIAGMHKYILDKDDDLIEILPELEGAMVQRFIVYPEQLRNSKRIIAFRQFIERKALEHQDF
ncbi:MAG: LysR family transcriptional regulator [Caedibacter sp. 38-128]|nr:LysR family transcriptional regulator [Holosporales bacterium]OJX07078.1 MAG: LysR family transcriptional regulator [Caedibacter sp. 38-128]